MAHRPPHRDTSHKSREPGRHMGTEGTELRRTSQLFARLEESLSAVAKQNKWPADTHRRVRQYAEELVHGNGNVPLGLSDSLRDLVRLRFVTVCKGYRGSQLPAQKSDWYRRMRARQESQEQGRDKADSRR